MELHEMDPRLVEVLRSAGNEWGALGVAKAAAELTDPQVLAAELGVRPAVEDLAFALVALDCPVNRNPARVWQEMDERRRDLARARARFALAYVADGAPVTEEVLRG
jgi:hypothetical protein